MAQLVREFASGVYNLILGLFTAGKHLGRHAVTVQYPKERWTMPERSRGMVVLLSDKETGELNCTACLLCMRACPSGAIDIEFEKDEKNRRQLKEFKLNYHICCFCGLCEASCNFTAIKLATKYEFPVFDKNELLWDTRKLQEMGLDVPYEKKKKERPADRKLVAKKPEAEAASEEKQANAETETKETEETDKKTVAQPVNPPSENKNDSAEANEGEEK